MAGLKRGGRTIVTAGMANGDRQTYRHTKKDIHSWAGGSLAEKSEHLHCYFAYLQDSITGNLNKTVKIRNNER